MKNHVIFLGALRGAQILKREIEIWDPPTINKFGV
jgi:hypothetical protein